MLPTHIQESVAKGKTPVSAALELTKLPTDKQVKTFDDLASSGGKVTAAKVKEKRQEAHEATGEGGPVPRTVKQLRTFLEGKTGPADPGHKLASYVLDYLAGKKSDDNLSKYWDKSFSGTLWLTPAKGGRNKRPPQPATSSMRDLTDRRND